MLALSALIGLASGARTFLPLALTAWAISFGWIDTGVTMFDWLGAPALAAILTLLAFGELYGDKQPGAGSRQATLSLAGRMVAGGIAGAALAVAGGQALAGGAIGAIAAAVGTFATHRFRKAMAERLGRDLPAALVEDALIVLLVVVTLGMAAS